MKGYTIQHSIEKLEKAVENGGGGGGGSTSAANVTYDNTQSGLTATDVQAAVDELDTDVDTINTKIVNAMTFPTDNTPIVIGKYGERDILRKRVYLATLVTGQNSLVSAGAPVMDILIDVHGFVKSNESSPRYMPINSDINTSNWYNGIMGYLSGSANDLFIGAPFNGGSAEIWFDYVAPVTVTSKKKGGK